MVYPPTKHSPSSKTHQGQCCFHPNQPWQQKPWISWHGSQSSHLCPHRCHSIPTIQQSWHPPRPSTNATSIQIAQTNHNYTKSIQQCCEYKNLHNALKKQIVCAIDNIYLCSSCDRYVEFTNVDVDTMLQFLFNSYDCNNPTDLLNNTNCIKLHWEANTPLNSWLTKLKNVSNLLTLETNPSPPQQIMNTAYTLIFHSRSFFDNCKIMEQQTCQ